MRYLTGVEETTALDAGIDEFVLWPEEGVGVYGTREYNPLSFQGKGEEKDI